MVQIQKAHYEVLRGSLRKAVKMLSCHSFNLVVADMQVFHAASEVSCAPVFFNNLGCIHQLMQKSVLANIYFREAVSASAKAVAGNSSVVRIATGEDRGGPPDTVVSKSWLDRRGEISYNLAVNMLMLGRNREAFVMFTTAMTPRANPRVWLRLAECCIAMHQTATPSGQDSGTGRPQGTFVWPSTDNPLGSSARPRVVAVTGGQPAVEPAGPEPGMGDVSPEELATSLSTSPDRALTYAASCLRNVLVLVGPLLEKDKSKRDARRSSVQADVRDRLEAEANLLEDAALVKQAYIALHQADYLQVLASVKRILTKNGLSQDEAPKSRNKDDDEGSWLFQWGRLWDGPGKKSEQAAARFPSSAATIHLAVMYGTEALLLLGRAGHAKQLLQPFVEHHALPKHLHQSTLVSNSTQARLLERPPSAPGSVAADRVDQHQFNQILTGGCATLQPSHGVGGYLVPSAKDKSEEKDSKDRSWEPPTRGPCQLGVLADAQATQFINLAAVACHHGDLNHAERLCDLAARIGPSIHSRNMQVYLSLARDDPTGALAALRGAKRAKTTGAGRRM